MRYVVYGAGAVGGVVGARLHLAGTATTLVARGEHLARIRESGLVLDTADGRSVARAAATDGAADVAWDDDTVVLLCVKGHQTPAALADLAAHAPETTPVVAVQNGIANESDVLRHFEHTYAIAVILPSLHREPGIVVQKCHPTPGILDVGRFPSGVDSTTEAIAADLARAGFQSVPRPDIMSWKRRKLVTNIAGDITAVLGRDEASVELATRVRIEGEAVLAAAGLSLVSAAEDDERRGAVLQLRADSADHPGNSLRQSLDRGLDSEVDYRAGEVVLLGRLHGVPTPASEAFRRTVNDLVRRGARPQTASAARLLEVLDQPTGTWGPASTSARETRLVGAHEGPVTAVTGPSGSS